MRIHCERAAFGRKASFSRRYPFRAQKCDSLAARHSGRQENCWKLFEGSVYVFALRSTPRPPFFIVPPLIRLAAQKSVDPNDWRSLFP